MKQKILAILPISIGGRLTTSSIIDGFRQNDYDVIVYDELYPQNDLETVLKSDYKYIVGYDFSGLKIKIDNNIEITSINYFSDEIRNKTSGPCWKKYLPYLNNNDNFVFYWDKELCKEENFPNMYYLPHFVNCEIYKNYQTTPKYDVMFAGRLDTDFRLNLFENMMKRLPELKFCWYAIEKHYIDAKERANNPKLIEKAYQGFIDNEKDMAKAINNTKIVFNMNSQGLSSLNYRTFQTTACKKLLISDYRKELSLFNGNMPFYTNIDDLIEKIKYYIENQTAYKDIVENCYQITIQNHHSKENVKYIINTIENNKK
jgi:hypothetical protein